MVWAPLITHCLVLAFPFFASQLFFAFHPSVILVFQKQINYGQRREIWRMEKEMVKGIKEEFLGGTIQWESPKKRGRQFI